MREHLKSLFLPAPFSHSLKLYVSANALLRAAGIGRGILLTWLMRSQAEFGLYQLGMLLINLLLPVLSLGAYEGLARYVPIYESRGLLWRFLRKALPAVTAIGAVLCMVLLLLWGWVGDRLISDAALAGEAGRIGPLIAVCVGGLLLYHSVLGLLRGRRMFRAVSLMELLNGIIFTVGAVAASLLEKGTAAVVLGIYAAATLLTTLLFGAKSVIQASREARPSQAALPPRVLADLLRFSFWSGCAAFAWQLLLVVPALILNHQCGEEALATYRAMTIFTQLGYVAPAAMSVVVFSAVARTWESAGQAAALQRLDLASKVALAAALLGCLLMAACGDLIILLFPHAYREGRDAIRMLLLFYLSAGALSFVTIRFALIKRAHMTFICWAGGLVVAVGWCALAIRPDRTARALVATAEAGALGAIAAMCLALILLWRTRLLPDPRLLVLLAGWVFLAASALVAFWGALLMTAMCLGTPLVLDSAERQVVKTHIKSLLRPHSQEPAP